MLLHPSLVKLRVVDSTWMSYLLLMKMNEFNFFWFIFVFAIYFVLWVLDFSTIINVEWIIKFYMDSIVCFHRSFLSKQYIETILFKNVWQSSLSMVGFGFSLIVDYFSSAPCLFFNFAYLFTINFTCNELKYHVYS
jgi:hypothetical protein